MKILIISRGIPNHKDPQEGCFEMDQAIALSKLGHEVVLMGVDGRFRKYWRKLGITKVNNQGVTAYKLFIFPTSVIKRLISYKLGYKINSILSKYLYRYVTKIHGSFDIVHAHYLPIIYLASEIKKDIPGMNLVGTEHWSKVGQKKLSNEVVYLGKSSYPNLDLLIAVSKELSENIKVNFGVSSSIVHNLIDTSFLTDISPSPSKNFTIIAVGSLIHLKGFDILIRAFEKSGLAKKGIKLKIIGNGRERENLINLTAELGLKESVVFTGQLSKERVFKELMSASLYVLSSRSENFSVALIEASACGLPAIATLCGGVREFPLSNLIKVPIDDVEAMSEALIKSYENRTLVDRQAIQKECLDYFSPEAIGHQLEDIYKTIQ